MRLTDDLIFIKDGKLAMPSAYACTILEFKGLSPEELSFVYFMVDHRSPYAVYEWEQRIKEVKESIFDKNLNGLQQLRLWLLVVNMKNL